MNYLNNSTLSKDSKLLLVNSDSKQSKYNFKKLVKYVRKFSYYKKSAFPLCKFTKMWHFLTSCSLVYENKIYRWVRII